MTERNVPRAGRGPGLLLWGSVCLNLLLIGLFVGWFLSGQASGHKPGGGGEGPKPQGELDLSRSFLATLPMQERREARRELIATWRGLEMERRALHEARKAVGAALAAEPFDTQGLATALDAYRDADRALRRAVEAPLIARLGALSVQERERLARALTRPRMALRGGGVGEEGSRPPSPELPPQ